MTADGAGTACSQEPHAGYVDAVPFDFARRHLVLGVGSGSLPGCLLISEDSSRAAVWNAGVLIGAQPPTETVDAEQLARRIDAAYASVRSAAEGSAGQEADDGAPDDPDTIDALLDRADRDLLSTEGKGPIVKLVDAILFEALGRAASDVHIHPLDDRTLVRYRIDGVLHAARELPPPVTAAVVSRVKVMGRMDIAERRVPQDGRATVTIGRGDAAKAIDLRISSLPTSYGERVVVRLLDVDRGARMTTFDALGMPGDVRRAYLERAARPNGIVLLTGPTGSGKTTTLYTTLRWIAAVGSEHGRAGELNVMTIEDPIEYELSTAGVAISQSQINTKKGVTFASGLRHILRQDPDVVMVGEIRDAETARTAIQASLTGHLVFSTLHTNDAASAVVRLVDLGIEPYLVGASLSAVLAQRLVRKTHQPCAGDGCDACFGSGYLGRTGLFELLTVTEPIRTLITSGGSASDIHHAAEARGMRTLRSDGMRLVADGHTSLVEIERATTDLKDDTTRPADSRAAEPKPSNGATTIQEPIR